MKKSQNKTLQHHKLILRHEIIASLTPLQLSHVASGSDNSIKPEMSYNNTDDYPCQSQVII